MEKPKCTITACKHYTQSNHGNTNLFPSEVVFVAMFQSWAIAEKKIAIIIPLSNN